MKKFWLNIIVVVVLLLGASGFFLLNQKINFWNNSLGEQNDYVGKQTTIFFKNFRAIIASDWQEFENSSSTYSVITYIPPNTDPGYGGAEVISIVVTYLGEDNNYDLEELLELGLKNSKQMMSDFELIENVDCESLGIPGKQIRFTGTQEGVKRTNIQSFGIEYDHLYTLTYSCPVDQCNYYAVYNVLVDSFEPVKSEKNYLANK